MNILELCLSPGLGGLELYMFRCVQALSSHHHMVTVLNTSGKLTSYFREHANPVTETRTLGRSSKLLPLRNARRLGRIIDDHEIDVIHMHWGNDLALAALAKRFSARKPALVYTRQMKITRYKNDWYHRYLYSQMDLMLTITRQLEKEAKRFIPGQGDQITTLYYGVDPPAVWLSAEEIRERRLKLGFGEDDFIIGLLGRLEQGKGQHLLIAALAIAANENLQPKALIVGHEMLPGYRSELQQLADNSGLAADVTFMDFTSEPQMLMQLCDCIALTSQEETFGLVLPEAMRAGIAVIGSDRGGVPEIITHEETGLLFESWNADSLYRQIRRLYTDADFRQQIAQNGKKEADARFNTEAHFAALERHLQQVTS